jgi:hypothetical protein
MALVFAGASVAQETPKSGPSGTAVGHYELSKAELALDCRKLTGKMQIRILQIRDYVQRAKTSTVSRLAQQGLTPIYGGTQYGADPDAQYRRDLAMLYAYNRQLAAKKCNTFDLDAELKPQPIEHTPRPVGPKQN